MEYVRKIHKYNFIQTIQQNGTRLKLNILKIIIELTFVYISLVT